MGKTIVEKIFSLASGKDVYAKDIVVAKVDAAMAHDGTALLAIEAFEDMGGKNVWDPSRIVLVIDHVAPSSNENFAKVHEVMRSFARKYGVRIYDVGSGICHQVMVESGHVGPGSLIVGADSHTCTYGALGAFATGIGSTEMAAVFATGRIWLRIPQTIKMNVTGRFQEFVTPKDLILYIIGKVGADGAIYKAIEFTGPTIREMNVSGRLTLCNMVVEMGAKNGIIEPDEKTIEYIKSRVNKPFKVFRSDPDAKYYEVMEFNVDSLEPMVACPHSVDNVKPVKSVEGVEIDQAFLGSCTNGRLEDLEVAARILKGRRIKRGVRMIVTPASTQVYLEAVKRGLIEIFIRAGACVSNPTCGACFGGHMGLLASGEVCISSSNRNFVGRMGSPEAMIYLASPATVAASAVEGKITDPRRFSERSI
ncbi:MAG: 3-isopropylmalate dehydratase large subunit [Candidatus Bathyarchaeia archaeon]